MYLIPFAATAMFNMGQISTCTGLAAIDHVNVKFHKGYAATGVVAVICARHEFWLPNGTGDTQVGER